MKRFNYFIVLLLLAGAGAATLLMQQPTIAAALEDAPPPPPPADDEDAPPPPAPEVEIAAATIKDNGQSLFTQFQYYSLGKTDIIDQDPVKFIFDFIAAIFSSKKGEKITLTAAQEQRLEELFTAVKNNPTPEIPKYDWKNLKSGIVGLFPLLLRTATQVHELQGITIFLTNRTNNSALKAKLSKELVQFYRTKVKDILKKTSIFLTGSDVLAL